MLPIDQLHSYQNQVFQGRENPWGKLLIVGCLTNRGDFPAFRLNGEADKEFAILSSEDDPSFWMQETRWSSFEPWMDKLVSSFGEEDLP